nr:MFS transporter [Holdemanella biformis]
MHKKQWMPLLGMTIAAFIFNTSEFMPIGLLTDIAQTFSITQAQAGAMITIYSWAVMLLSLPLMILASKYNLKKVLLTTLFLFGLGQAISAISMNFAILILGRLVVACAHAVFWSIASVIAVRLVNEDKREFAMSMIVTGTSVAMIAGLPLGRMIGLWMGWRITFLIVGIISILLLLFQTHYLPSLETTSAFTLYQLPTLLRNKQLLPFTVFPYYLRVPTIRPIAISNPSYHKSQFYPIQQLHLYSLYLVLPESVEVSYSLISTTRTERDSS